MRALKQLMAIILSFGMVLIGSITTFAAELPEQSSEEFVLIEDTVSQIVEGAVASTPNNN